MIIATYRAVAGDPGGPVAGQSWRVTWTGDVRWWTWAGWHANATLIATLGNLADPTQRVEDFYIRLRGNITPQAWKAATDGIEERLCLPAVEGKALDGRAG